MSTPFNNISVGESTLDRLKYKLFTATLIWCVFSFMYSTMPYEELGFRITNPSEAIYYSLSVQTGLRLFKKPTSGRAYCLMVFHLITSYIILMV
jgi:hypothetical protein